MKRWPLHKAYFWETTPFFRILLPLVVGILVYDQISMRSIPGSAYVTLIIIVFLLCTGLIYRNKSAGSYSIITFVTVNILFLLGGISISYFNDIGNDKAWFGNTLDQGNSYLARLTDAPAEKEHSWKLPVEVLSSIKDNKAQPLTGGAFVYLYKDTQPVLLHKGDSVLLPDKWQLIHNAGNPFEFDYTTYCHRNNVVYQQSCSISDLRLYATNDPDAVPIITRSHDWCMQQLDKYITDSKTKGLIQAMLLGDEVNLDDELRQSYSETGIIHIIAISGGNVAIFFLVISFLLWWMKDRKHLWVKYAIALPLVWFYVIMAGAPPSAIRAAIMFSLLAFSVMLQKNNNSLNTLFATAFLLLCAEPMWLFSVGFQLSFVAVLSLILFYAPIYKWLSPVHPIAKLLWGTVTASISAEVLVAPLVIYYFHTFPLLFIVANVAAYLFMGLVLVMGIAIMGFSWMPVAAKGIGMCTAWLVTVFDRIILWLQGFNPPSFHFLMVTGAELSIIYVAVSGIALFFMKQQKAALFVGLGAVCLLVVSLCNDEWTRLHQRHLVVYNTGKANQAELIHGNTFTVLNTDTSIAKKARYATKPAHINWRAWKEDKTPGNEIFDIGGKTVLLLNEELTSTGVFHVDYVIINYTGKVDPGQIKTIFSPAVVVVGDDYSRKQQGEIGKKFGLIGVKTHTIATEGAFVID